MKFLSSDQAGDEVGCIGNRYLERVDPAKKMPIRRSFGMGFWRDIGCLEAWSKSHPTHLRIFGTAIKYYQTFGDVGRLHFGHEVTIIDPDRCVFEYADCFAATGLLTQEAITSAA